MPVRAGRHHGWRFQHTCLPFAARFGHYTAQHRRHTTVGRTGLATLDTFGSRIALRAVPQRHLTFTTFTVLTRIYHPSVAACLGPTGSFPPGYLPFLQQPFAGAALLFNLVRVTNVPRSAPPYVTAHAPPRPPPPVPRRAARRQNRRYGTTRTHARRDALRAGASPRTTTPRRLHHYALARRLPWLPACIPHGCAMTTPPALYPVSAPSAHTRLKPDGRPR